MISGFSCEESLIGIQYIVWRCLPCLRRHTVDRGLSSFSFEERVLRNRTRNRISTIRVLSGMDSDSDSDTDSDTDTESDTDTDTESDSDYRSTVAFFSDSDSDSDSDSSILGTYDQFDSDSDADSEFGGYRRLQPPHFPIVELSSFFRESRGGYRFLPTPFESNREQVDPEY